MSQNLVTLDLAAYAHGWNAWRDERESRRQDPYGYLSYSAFHQLDTTPRRFAGVPGTWTTGTEGPSVHLAEGEELMADGEIVAGRHAFAPVREREFRRAAQVGEVIIELSKRGGCDLLRPVDPAFGERLRSGYRGTPTYEPDLRWIVEGQFVAFDVPRDVVLGATIGDFVHLHPAVGQVLFDVDGVEQRLVVFARDDYVPGSAGSGFTNFRDATSGSTTFAAGRGLGVDLPGGSGPLTLDFNRAHNTQSAYTRYAPCPLPPEHNYLTVPIEAGEKVPVFRR